ncbi:MAG: LysM peptidoglycan-binding domain-containing protein [Clostridia bacterium]|nr:LysM peptidoglycan-binding domain-containing protein [Clostridia bacterium]
MLKRLQTKRYKVKRGQTAASLAAACGVNVYFFVKANGLKEELYEGQLVHLPDAGNLYTVRAGDTPALLCGSKEGYEKRNGTEIFYPGMRVLL